MKKNKALPENFLEKIPLKNKSIGFSVDDKGMVTLEIENTGAMNRIAQKLFKKPRVSYIHLDGNGSFIWQRIDGEKNLIAIGEEVKEYFGEAAEPLYPRLAKFTEILKSYGFITFKQ